MSITHHGLELRGRRSECQSLDRLLEDVRGGRSRVLVLRGDAGVGKTALLDYVAASASACRIARSAGVESEMELAFAGLHQLCAPMLPHLAHLPGPQRHALGTAFGLAAGAAADRFLVGLAVLSLLSRIAEERPSSAWWTTRSGSIGPRRRSSASWLAAFWRNRWPWCSRLREPGDEVELGNLPVMVVGGLNDS